MNQINIMKVFDKKQYKPIQLRDKGATARVNIA